MAPHPDLLAALTAPDAAASLRELDRAGVLTRLIPDLEAGKGFTQPELHYFDVFDHSLAAVGALETVLGPGEAGAELRAALQWLDLDESLAREVGDIPLRALLRLACLLHDVAKPATATVVEGRLRFPRHGPRGAEIVRDLLPALGFTPDATDFVARLVGFHLRPVELVRGRPPSDRAVRKFVNDLDGHVLPLMLVNLADGMATSGPRRTREQHRRHCRLVNYVVAHAYAVAGDDERQLVTGDDLIEVLNLESGRLLGMVLTSVRQAQLEGTISDREEALAFARTVLASLKAQPNS